MNAMGVAVLRLSSADDYTIFAYPSAAVGAQRFGAPETRPQFAFSDDLGSFATRGGPGLRRHAMTARGITCHYRRGRQCADFRPSRPRPDPGGSTLCGTSG